MLAEHGLNFAELDAEAAELDLVVDAPQELNIAVGQPARQVAGLVEAAWSKGIGDELFGSQFGAVEVCACQTNAGDAEFPGHADRGRLAMLMQDVSLCVGDGASDRWGLLVVLPSTAIHDGGANGCFGWSVRIEKATIVRPACGQGGRAGFAGRDHRSQVR